MEVVVSVWSEAHSVTGGRVSSGGCVEMDSHDLIMTFEKVTKGQWECPGGIFCWGHYYTLGMTYTQCA